MIKYIKNRCNIGITIGLRDKIAYADESQGVAKNNGFRGIVSIYYMCYSNKESMEKKDEWTKMALFADNDDMCSNVMKKWMFIDDRDKFDVRSALFIK